MADISIEGDVKAQQGIRFNIFQLNQTYLGKDSALNMDLKDLQGKNMEEARIGIQKLIVFRFIWLPKIKMLLEIY